MNRDTLLVLGAGGMLGAALARQFGKRAVALDRAALDITDIVRFREALVAYRPAVVVNAAGMSQGSDDTLYHYNAYCPANLAAACADVGCRFMFLSSSRVFGNADPLRRHEDAVPVPADAYGASKLAGEKRIREIMGDDGCYIVRLAMVLGLRERHSNAQIVNRLLEKAHNGDKSVFVSFDVVHTPVHVLAAVAILDHILSRVRMPGTYHVTGAAPVTLDRLIRHIFTGLGLGTEVVGVPSRHFEANPLLDLTLGTRAVPTAGPWEAAAASVISEYAASWKSVP